MLKFRSQRSRVYLSTRSYSSEGLAFDLAEFTKSEREKAAEALNDWRARRGWQMPEAHRPGVWSRVLHRYIRHGMVGSMMFFGFGWRFFAFLLLPQAMIVPLLKTETEPVARRVLGSWCGLHTVALLMMLIQIF